MILNFKNKKLICNDCNSIMLPVDNKHSEFSCLCKKNRYYSGLNCFFFNKNNFGIRAYLYEDGIYFVTNSTDNLNDTLRSIFKDKSINDYKSLSGFVSDLEKTINNMIFY